MCVWFDIVATRLLEWGGGGGVQGVWMPMINRLGKDIYL